MLIALNFDESQRGDSEKHVKLISEKKEGRNTKIVSFFGKIELEILKLPDEEAKVFMEEYGIKESALNTLIREAYALLGASFLLHRWWRRMQSMDNQERNDSTGSRRRHSLWLFCQSLSVQK